MTHSLPAKGEGFFPSSSREGWKLYAAITCGVLLIKNTKAIQYKVQNIWQFISVITPYFSMIKFALKRTLTSEDNFKDEDRDIYICVFDSSGSRLL